jgi:lipopolysaccharide export system permease protein
MIPTLWRFCLESYFKIFSISVASFISVLIVSRFKEIARFGALSWSWLQTGLFTLYQIPLILPLAIPISALLASLLLFQRLKSTFELTALRSSGLSFKAILSPLLFAAALLSLLNFSFCAEISPYCRRETKRLLYKETSANPLLLLQRQSLVKIKHAYLNMDVREEGQEAGNLTLIAHNESNQRLSLLSAKKLCHNEGKLLGYDVSIISHLHSDKEDSFDPLIIENQASMTTSAPLLSAALKKHRPRLEVGALTLRMLRLRCLESGKQALSARVEILRRLSLTIAVFTFTLLGCAFHSKKELLYALLLALLLLVTYLLGKELKASPILSVVIFLAPHPILWLLSIYKLQRTAKGYT